MQQDLIGLLTCSEAINYGTMLQTFATQSLLERFGKKVIVIDFRARDSKAKSYSIKNAKTWKSKISFILFYFHRKKKTQAFANFKENKIKYSKKVYSKENLSELYFYMNKFPCICIGSDQVWNPAIQDIEIFTLGKIADNVKKISFASSMGNAFSRPEIQNTLKKNIERFDFISVREEKAKAYLEKYLKRKIDRLLDPTLVFEDFFWRKLQKPVKVPKKYILLYLASNSIGLLKFAYKRAKKNDCSLLILSDIYIPSMSLNVKNLRGISPENFLFLIDHALEVYTNSYHGMVFSINFNKNFGVEFPIKDDDRIETVLNLFGLKHRDIKSGNFQDIDYKQVNKTLKIERIKTEVFLKRVMVGINNE